MPNLNRFASSLLPANGLWRFCAASIESLIFLQWSFYLSFFFSILFLKGLNLSDETICLAPLDHGNDSGSSSFGTKAMHEFCVAFGTIYDPDHRAEGENINYINHRYTFMITMLGIITALLQFSQCLDTFCDFRHLDHEIKTALRALCLTSVMFYSAFSFHSFVATRSAPSQAALSARDLLTILNRRLFPNHYSCDIRLLPDAPKERIVAKASSSTSSGGGGTLSPESDLQLDSDWFVLKTRCHNPYLHIFELLFKFAYSNTLLISILSLGLLLLMLCDVVSTRRQSCSSGGCSVIGNNCSIICSDGEKDKLEFLDLLKMVKLIGNDGK